ncbi:hypothetical protein [Streptomyces griseocarneus]|uniref:hypothetical protein n=1 Tax=Streptomyces griseocarneus TaxID=51201 RepID=UPI00167E44A5|nr:hypothetical protein [Streptomyces griseocarneus]MBZ6474896.1 hypothetical protein [Streptomyces griseocarneus]GHG48740.1 hypothetical protein GCM10018779_07180 [Streptomyces griseocarneus]
MATPPGSPSGPPYGPPAGPPAPPPGGFGPGGPPWSPDPPPAGGRRRIALAVIALLVVSGLALGAVLVMGHRGDGTPGQDASASGRGKASPSFSLPSGLPSSLPSGLPSWFPSGLPTSLPSAFPTGIFGP